MRREKGEVSLPTRELEIYKRVFELGHRDYVMTSPPTIPIMGRVGAGAEIYPIAEFAPGEGLGEIECPPNLDPDTTTAVLVEGDSMFPLESGWILFYSRFPEPAAEDVIGHLCIVELDDDGPTLVKQVRRGHERGRFNLLSSNAPMLENVRLKSAARVLAMQPPASQRKSFRS